MNYGIGNVKAKIGGGGAELNIAYGLTPPSDTSKIWVKCDTPSKVKIEANRQLVISSSENAKMVKTEEIELTRFVSNQYRRPSNLMVKIGDDYYYCTFGDTTSYMENNNVNRGRVYKRDINGNITTLYQNGSPTYCESLGLYKYDETHLIFVFIYSSGTPKIYANVIDIRNGEVTNYSFASGSVAQFSYGMWYYNNKVYGLMGEDNASNKLFINVYTLGGNVETYSIDMPSGLYRAIAPCSPVFYNNALYFILNVGDTSSSASSTFTKQPKLYKWVIGDSQIVEVLTLPYIKYGGTDYGIAFYTPLIYGNKMFITNLNHFRSTSIATADSSVVYIVDLDAETYETFDLLEMFSLAYTCLNENTGDLEIWGGYPSTPIGHKKRIIYNIYELEENTLDLFYDTYFTKNLRLIDSPTITIDAPIDHAWLGDSNDIAQSVDMFYYENGLWYGVNCLGWTELKSVEVNISNITTNNDSYQNQFTLTPVWANQSGVCLVRGIATYSEVYNALTIPIANVDVDKLIDLCIEKGTDVSSQIGLPVYTYIYMPSVIAETKNSQTIFMACDFIVDATYQAVLDQMDIPNHIGDRVKACFSLNAFYGNELGLALIAVYLHSITGMSFTFSHPNTWVDFQDNVLTSMNIGVFANDDLSPFDLTNATIQYMIDCLFTEDATDTLNIDVYDEYGLKATKTITIAYSSDFIGN